MDTLEKLLKELPPDLEQEVKDFVYFLLATHSRWLASEPQDRTGALRDYREQYTAQGLERTALPAFTRITVDPYQMGGVPCIRGLRIPVATVIVMVAEGISQAEILQAWPDLEAEDIRQALRFAAAAVQERALPFALNSKLLPESRQKEPRGKPTFEWGGALGDLRDQYTSVELQHTLSDWRSPA